MKKVFSIILVIILLISLTACGRSESPVGSWHYAKNDTFNLVLNKDGTCTLQIEDWSSVQHLTWRYDDSTNFIYLSENGTLLSPVLIYSPDQNTIKFSDFILTRK